LTHLTPPAKIFNKADIISRFPASDQRLSAKNPGRLSILLTGMTDLRWFAAAFRSKAFEQWIKRIASLPLVDPHRIR
jgi:hypothetical protein